MIAAHTDEIGLMVKSIEANGFLRFVKIGGVLDNLLAARLVRVKGQLGLIGMKAGHYQTPEERRQIKSSDDMYIDIGARSAAEVAARGITIGDPISFVSPLAEISQDPPLVAGKAVDNRLGCAILSLLIEEQAPPAGTLVAAFTSQEEVGLKGAGAAAFRFRPSLALALDTMPAGDTPDMNEHTQLSTKLGAGPCLQVLAGSGGKGFLVPPAVHTYLTETARNADIPYQRVTFTGGNNDATSMGWAGEGVPAASICLPRRYSHSPLELADLRDAEASLALLREIALGMNRLPSFDFLDA